MEMAVILNLVFICLTSLIVTSESNRFSSQNSRHRSVQRAIPREIRHSNLRSIGSRSRNVNRSIKVRAPTITLRELIAILQARRIRNNLRRSNPISSQRVAHQPQITRRVNPVAPPATHTSNMHEIAPSHGGSVDRMNNNNNFQDQLTRQLLLSTLFGNDGKFIDNALARNSGFVDPRPQFSNHHKEPPALQVKSKNANVSPLVIETSGNIKVSEIKNANGQTQVIIDTTGPKNAPPAVTLKPGEDPPEPEFKFPM